MTTIQLSNLFIASLSDPKKLTAALQLKKGKAFLYFIFILLISAIPAGIETFSTLSNINQAGQEIVKELPPFTITNGTFTSKETVKNFTKETTSLTFVFDPKGTDSNAEDQLSNRLIGVGFLKDGLHFLTPFQENTYEYQDLEGMDNQSVENFLGVIKQLGFYSSIFVILFMTIILTLMNNLLYTVFANLITALTRRRLPFGQVWNMTLVASTLPTLFFVVTTIFGIQINYQTQLTLIVTVYIYYLALRTLPKAEV
ncbi:DUF1189 domain-containing protein [Carnobacterium gallinarum]|uniref:DUF1189 domain-containing protein n=1 Tax=Carnobacterium gallinarum TaxID=2749 RepID=UPI00054ED3D3|nr:DUF1189 domain-containing protein [Carnobacterium gallinarum]